MQQPSARMPAQAGSLVDVSVLVQWRRSGVVVLDANVSLAVEPLASLALARSDRFAAFRQPLPPFSHRI
jgi:hypothetical protein